MNPGISIIIPLFNKGKFILSALQAFSQQLAEGDEIIVVDDRSTDDGAGLARAFFDTMPGRGRIVTMPENAGPGSARNMGAGIATGSHLLFFDADDIPSSILLAALRDAIGRHPQAAVFAYHISFEARGGQGLSTGNGEAATIVRPKHAFVLDAVNGKTLCTASSTCVRRDAFLAADNGFKEGLRYCEDPELWARLSAVHDIVELPQTLAIYRDVPASLSYGHRGRIGSVNPYVDTLMALATRYGGEYARLARGMVFKNLVFARAAGASYRACARQLSSYRTLLGASHRIVLRLIALVPAALFDTALRLRARAARAG